MNDYNQLFHYKSIDDLIKDRFSHYDYNSLCNIFYRTNYHKKWGEFWQKINNQKLFYIPSYFGCKYTKEEALLLRLLIVEEFKKYCGE